MLGAALGAGAPAALGAAAVVAVAAAAGEARGLRIAPQIRRQVPEAWRRTLPVPLAAAGYGVLLGLGFTTFVLSFAVWALAGISVAVGDPALGLAMGLAFGAGRALPVVALAPAAATRRGAAVTAAMLRAAGDPARPATARRGRARRRRARAGRRLGMRRRPRGRARLRRCSRAARTTRARRAASSPGSARATARCSCATGRRSRCPAAHPALGGARIAWREADELVIADAATLQPAARVVAPGAGVLARQRPDRRVAHARRERDGPAARRPRRRRRGAVRVARPARDRAARGGRDDDPLPRRRPARQPGARRSTPRPAPSRSSAPTRSRRSPTRRPTVRACSTSTRPAQARSCASGRSRPGTRTPTP